MIEYLKHSEAEKRPCKNTMTPANISTFRFSFFFFFLTFCKSDLTEI